MTSWEEGRIAVVVALGGMLLAGCAGRQAMVTQDHDSASRLRVAAAAEASGQPTIALSMYGAAAAAEPDSADIQARYAAALIRNDELWKAEQVLNKAVGRRPNDPLLLVQLGRLRLRSGAAIGALEIFSRALVTEPRSVAALDGQGVALDLLGRYAEAERSHRAAMALAPDNFSIANNLAVSLLLAGRPGEAAEVLEPLVGSARLPPRMMVNLAIARSASGDREGALSLLAPQDGGRGLDRAVAALSGTVSTGTGQR